METIKNEEWFCMLCGCESRDEEWKGVTFEKHLAHHSISQQQYNVFVHEQKGGLEPLKVKLLSWSNNVENAIVAFVSQTWGPTFCLDEYSEEEVAGIVQMALEGKTLPLALESISFTFQIDNLSRAISHQLVRVRIGSSFSQKGMSDTYYGNTQYIIPASIEAVGKTKEYMALLDKCSNFYNELFEAGVPFQDARYIIPHAATTSLVWSVNLLALKNFCAQRLSCTQSWEMNALCKLIRNEINKVYPAIASILKPKCEITKKCNSFGNLYEGCGKYPMNEPERNFVFTKEQMAKNLRFNDEYRTRVTEHNKSVKPENNYFKETVNKNGKI